MRLNWRLNLDSCPAPQAAPPQFTLLHLGEGTRQHLGSLSSLPARQIEQLRPVSTAVFGRQQTPPERSTEEVPHFNNSTFHCPHMRTSLHTTTSWHPTRGGYAHHHPRNCTSTSKQMMILDYGTLPTPTLAVPHTHYSLFGVPCSGITLTPATIHSCLDSERGITNIHNRRATSLDNILLTQQQHSGFKHSVGPESNGHVHGIRLYTLVATHMPSWAHFSLFARHHLTPPLGGL